LLSRDCKQLSFHPLWRIYRLKRQDYSVTTKRKCPCEQERTTGRNSEERDLLRCRLL